MDIYDEDENQPMSVLVNPDTCIPDPKCWNSSEMRFFWFSRSIPSWKLKNSDVYDLQWMQIEDLWQDANLQQSNNARSQDYAIYQSNGLVDLYEHYTIYEGKKVLTTWVNERSKIIRFIEIEPLTKAEELNPMKTKFNIIFHRRKP